AAFRRERHADQPEAERHQKAVQQQEHHAAFFSGSVRCIGLIAVTTLVETLPLLFSIITSSAMKGNGLCLIESISLEPSHLRSWVQVPQDVSPFSSTSTNSVPVSRSLPSMFPRKNLAPRT